MCRAGGEKDKTMKRYAFCLALVSIGTVSISLPVVAAATTAQAKKFCSEQWDIEKKANTVPRGMTQAKYMSQCTKNYAANAPTTPQAAAGAPADQGASAAWPATTPSATANQSGH
jgi:hypothetical protein